MEAFDNGVEDRESREKIAHDLEEKRIKDKKEFHWNSLANIIQIIAIIAMIWIGLKQLKREKVIESQIKTEKLP
jgi:sulfite exporter TauE/SafE